MATKNREMSIVLVSWKISGSQIAKTENIDGEKIKKEKKIEAFDKIVEFVRHC